MAVKQDRGDQKRLRAFIAIELPEHIVSTLKDVQLELRSYDLGIRWTAPEKIHLTLKFLGDIDRSQTSSVTEALERSVRGVVSMRLSVKGIGVFPGVKRPRVLWAGVSGQVDELRKLQKDLDRELVELGFPAETRSYTGHLTLGRLKGRHAPDGVIRMMEAFKAMESEAFAVDAVNLYQSRLFPLGPVYTKLFAAGLAGHHDK